MDGSATSARPRLPERGEPRHASCAVCGHAHACYVIDRPGPDGVAGPGWSESPVCLGCLMRAADPDARVACAECVFPG